MPRAKSYPLLFDQTMTISIKLLKKNGFLNQENQCSGLIQWKCSPRLEEVYIRVSINEDVGFMELRYQYHQTKIHYFVELDAVPSNLGRGLVWYFICPLTGQYCRKLYLGTSHFYHRTAFDHGMYEKQTGSKKVTQFDKLLNVSRRDVFGSRLFKKYAKTHYAAKPTKWFLRLMKHMRQVNDVPYERLKALIMK